MSALFRERIYLSGHKATTRALLTWALTLTFIALAPVTDASEASSSAQCYGALKSETAHISRVSDGDTVVLQDDRRVRLIGINTAELNARNPKLKQAAQNAKTALAELLPEGTSVTLFLGEEPEDRHGRVLAHVVRAHDHLPVASTLVSSGLAVQSAVAPNTRCAPYFAKLETAAAKNNTGDWDKLWLFNKQAAQLFGNERGFHFVTGKVSGVEKHKRYTEVFLDQQFRLLLKPALANAMQLDELAGQTVQVRGWLNHRKGQTFLWLQHQSNLRVLEP